MFRALYALHIVIKLITYIVRNPYARRAALAIGLAFLVMFIGSAILSGLTAALSAGLLWFDGQQAVGWPTMPAVTLILGLVVVTGAIIFIVRRKGEVLRAGQRNLTRRMQSLFKATQQRQIEDQIRVNPNLSNGARNEGPDLMVVDEDGGNDLEGKIKILN